MLNDLLFIISPPSINILAKEAIIKALKSSGYNKPIPLLSIDIQSGLNGEPIVKLDISCSGKCRLSISHTDTHAIAFAIYINQ